MFVKHPDREDDRVDLHRLSSPLRSFQITAPVTFSSPSTSFSVKYGYFTRTWEERRRWTIASWDATCTSGGKRSPRRRFPSEARAPSPPALFPPPRSEPFTPRSGFERGRSRRSRALEVRFRCGCPVSRGTNARPGSEDPRLGLKWTPAGVVSSHGALPEDPQPVNPLVEDHLGDVLHRLIGPTPLMRSGATICGCPDVEDLLFRVHGISRPPTGYVSSAWCGTPQPRV